MKNDLKRIFLDREKTELFTLYLLRKNYIDKFIDGSELDYDKRKFIYKDRNLRGIKKLFILLTLYEEIGFSQSEYSYDRIFDMGITEMSSKLWSGYGESEVLNALYLMNIGHKRLMLDFKKKYTFVNAQNFEKILIELYIPIAKKYTYKSVKDIKQEVIYEIGNKQRITADMLYILSYITETFYSLVEGMGFPTNFYTDIFYGEVEKSTKIVENMYYFCKINLSQEFNVLPVPQTLEDVINYRKSPYIKSFRNIFEEWMNYIEEGNICLAKKVKKDVIKANQCFEKLEKYHKFSNNLFVRTSLFAGGFIPGLSEVINISTYAGGIIEDVLTRKNNWILISDAKR